MPMTVTATALRGHRRPSRKQVIGSLLSVGGVVALTVLLLTPSNNDLVLPSWETLTPPVAIAATGGSPRPFSAGIATRACGA